MRRVRRLQEHGDAGYFRRHRSQQLELLGPSSSAMTESPVTLPSGRDRLAANPSPTGSAAIGATTGTVRVAWWSARRAGVPTPTITSTFKPTSSAARAGSPSFVLAISEPSLDDEVLAL